MFAIANFNFGALLDEICMRCIFYCVLPRVKFAHVSEMQLLCINSEIVVTF